MAFIILCVVYARYPKQTVPRLRNSRGGAVDIIVPVSIQLQTSVFNLEFDTLFESI